MAIRQNRVRNLVAALVASFGLAVAASAAADPLQITIGSPTVGGFPAPYAQVTYDLVDSNTHTRSAREAYGYQPGWGLPPVEVRTTRAA